MDIQEDFPDTSHASPDVHTKYIIELFQHLRSKLVDMNLIQTIKDDPIFLFEIQGLLLKLNNREVPNPIVDLVLYFDPLIE